jgi:HEAT repeat protein
LQLLETSDKRWFGRYLTSINDPDAEIRLKTLRVLFFQKADMTYRVKRLLSDNDPRVRAEAIHYIGARARSPQQFLPKETHDEPPVFRVARIARDLRIGSARSAEKLEQLLNEALEQRDETTLEEIAHVLQFTPAKELCVKIYRRLLSNQSLEVRKATLKSIANTKPQTLIPYLLRLTRIPALKNEVYKCLGAYGKMLIPYLQQIISNSGETIPRRKLALKIAAETGGISIVESVLRVTHDPDPSLRFSAIKTLNNLRKSGIVPADHPSLRPLLFHEIETLEFEMLRSGQILPQPGGLL